MIIKQQRDTECPVFLLWKMLPDMRPSSEPDKRLLILITAPGEVAYTQWCRHTTSTQQQAETMFFIPTPFTAPKLLTWKRGVSSVLHGFTFKVY